MRASIRLLSLVIFSLAILLLPTAFSRYIFLTLSPNIALASAIANRALSWTLVLCLPLLVLMIWRKRFFCRYICPLGVVTDGCAKVRKSSPTFRRVPFFGQWFLLITLGGALVGYPIFLWLDPLAVFSAGLGGFSLPISLVGLAGLVLIVLVIIISITFPNIWCRKICPVGGAQDLLVFFRNFIRQKKKRPVSELKAGKKINRRIFVGLTIGLIGSLSGRLLLAAKTVIRPPGALWGGRFDSQCIRCGNCIRSCPSQIIQMDTDPLNPTGLLAPVLNFDADYCQEDCNRCTQSCPTGALQPLTMDSKTSFVIGVAKIVESKCILIEDRECARCVYVCPQEAITEKFFSETYTTMVKVDLNKCNGCGACINPCPVSVISIEPTGEQKYLRES